MATFFRIIHHFFVQLTFLVKYFKKTLRLNTFFIHSLNHKLEIMPSIEERKRAIKGTSFIYMLIRTIFFSCFSFSFAYLLRTVFSSLPPSTIQNFLSPLSAAAISFGDWESLSEFVRFISTEVYFWNIFLNISSSLTLSQHIH